MADKKQTAQDYASCSSVVPTKNTFQPLSFTQVLLSPTTPQKQNTKKPIGSCHKYFTKDYPFDNLCLTTSLTPLKQNEYEPFITNLFCPEFHWCPTEPTKTQKFYEFILVDSGSVEITHTRDTQNNQYITMSKCRILKVLTLKDWNKATELKNFSIPFFPKGYSYHDYKEAWFKTFYLRPFTHSWFIHFTKHCNNDFPIWFYNWWNFFGSSPQIFPDKAQLAFDYYIKNAKETDYTKPLRFHKNLQVGWIFCWIYDLLQLFPKPYPLSLCRIYKVRWWEKFDLELLTIDKVRVALSQQTHTPIQTQPSLPSILKLPSTSKLPETKNSQLVSSSTTNSPAFSTEQWHQFQAFQQYQLFMQSQNSPHKSWADQVDEEQSASTNLSPKQDFDDPEMFSQDPYAQ